MSALSTWAFGKGRNVKASRRSLLGALLLAALVLSGAVGAAGSEGPDVAGVRVDPASALAVGLPLGAAGMTVKAVVRLTDAPLALAYKPAGRMPEELAETYVRV